MSGAIAAAGIEFAIGIGWSRGERNVEARVAENVAIHSWLALVNTSTYFSTRSQVKSLTVATQHSACLLVKPKILGGQETGVINGRGLLALSANVIASSQARKSLTTVHQHSTSVVYLR